MSAEACDAAYQGDPGAYSEQAAWALVGPAASVLPCRTLTAMFDAVADGRARHAVLPIENTLAGTVPRAYELLLERGLAATGETRVHIDHVLVARAGVAPGAIRRVLSHPVALDQCRRFLTAHPEIEAVPVFDTAGAVAMALDEGDHRSAAIASRRAAALHGDAAIIAEGIQDHAENWTRFLLLAPRPAAPPPDSAHAIVAFTLPHEPGALAGVLAKIAAHGANLTKIESRPIEGRPFEYAFLVEVHLDPVRASAAELLATMRTVTDGVHWLGGY
jgi:prephenate dehydratase